MTRGVTCPDCDYRPRSAGGATAAAQLAQIEEQIHGLYSEWERVLADNLAVDEMIEQIGLLGSTDRQQVDSFVASRQLPDPVTDSLRRGCPAGSAPLRRPPDHTTRCLGRASPRRGARHSRRTWRAVQRIAE